MVRVGKHKHLVTIKKPVDSIGTSYEPTETWVIYAQRWASINPLSGDEFWSAKQVNAENTVRFRMRYCHGLTTKMRLEYDNRVFVIESILNYGESNREMVVLTKEDV